MQNFHKFIKILNITNFYIFQQNYINKPFISHTKSTKADNFSLSVVDPVQNGFRSPQRIRVIKIKKVDPTSWVNVTATVHFNVRATAINGNDNISCRCIVPLRFTLICNKKLANAGTFQNVSAATSHVVTSKHHNSKLQ